MQVNSTPILTLPCSAALNPYLRVKYDATYGLVVAGAEDVELGTTNTTHVVDGVGASSVASVVDAKAPGTVKMVAAGAFDYGATVYGAANGKVDDVANGNVIGIALQAASGDGAVVEVLRTKQAGTGAGSLSAAEMAVLDGVTPGTTAAGKVVTTAAVTNKVASLDITDLKIGGTSVTATAAELNALAGTGLSQAELAVLDGVTPGTTAAGKVVTTAADTNKVAEVDITSLKIGGTAITATAAEVNKLASSGAVVASGTAAVHMADLGDEASGAQIAAAVNTLRDLAVAFKMMAAS